VIISKPSLVSTHIHKPSLVSARIQSADTSQVAFLIVAVGVLAFVCLAAGLLLDNALWTAAAPVGLAVLLAAAWLIMRAMAGSKRAIILYLALVVFITDGQFRARGAGEIGADWQNMMKFALWAGAGAIGFAHMPPLKQLLTRLEPACCLAFIAVAIVSTLYSSAAGYTFGCALALLCFFAFAYALVTQLTEAEILWTIVGSLTVFLLIGWVVYYEDPDLGTSQFWVNDIIELRMCGIAGQANNLAASCAKFMGALFLLWWTGRIKLVVLLPLAALGLITLGASDGRTAMLSIIAGITVVILARSLWLAAAALLGGLAALLAATILSFRVETIANHFSRSGDPTEVFTLTGRLDIWRVVWDKIVEKPLLGWGYNSSKVVLGQFEGFNWGLMVDTAHNMWLQLLLSVGIIGTLPTVVALFALLWKTVVRPFAFRDFFVVVIIVTGISDAIALGSTPTVLTLMFFIACALPPTPGRSALKKGSLAGLGGPVPRAIRWSGA
jgi:O-antigen ligase